jgi:hypothetical protein
MEAVLAGFRAFRLGCLFLWGFRPLFIQLFLVRPSRRLGRRVYSRLF